MTAVAMHPQATEQAARIRWIVPGCPVAGCGRVKKAPQELESLIDDHIISSVTLVPNAIDVTLDADHTWADDGATVRQALSAALTHPDEWEVSEQDDGVRNAGVKIERTVTQLINGPIGEVIRSHGGRIEVSKVVGTDVWLTVSGTCAHCPALGALTGKHIDIQLHEILPSLGEVHWQRGATRSATPRFSGLRRLKLSVAPRA